MEYIRTNMLHQLYLFTLFDLFGTYDTVFLNEKYVEISFQKETA